MSGLHAPLAPSAAGQWVHCAASVSLQSQFPERDDADNEAAAEGTAAHHAFAELLRGNPWPDGPDYTAEMRQHLEPIVAALPAIGVRHVESRYSASTIHANNWGTPDLVHLDRAQKVAAIHDLKWGWGIVHDHENWQLLNYAAAVCDTVDELASWTFELWIHQPRVWHKDGTSRRWRLPYASLTPYLRHLRAAAEEAMGNDPLAHPGPYCKHCTARHVCKALRGAALGAIDQASDATPAELPPDALGLELSVMSRGEMLLAARLSGLRAHALAAIKSGKLVPGWRADRTPGREAWTKPVSEILSAGELMGVDLAKPAEAVTPNQARTAGFNADIVAAWSERKPGAVKLVPVTAGEAARAFGGGTLTEKEIV